MAAVPRVSLFAVGNGFTYGQQAAYFAELFPASIRYSGVSITYAIGAILGGAFAPTIAAWLVQTTGTATSVAFYIAGVMVVAFAATLLLRDRTGIPPRPPSTRTSRPSARSTGGLEGLTTSPEDGPVTAASCAR